MFKSLHDSSSDDSDSGVGDMDVHASPAARGRKIVKAKRGGAKKVTAAAAKTPTPVKASKGTKRSRTPALETPKFKKTRAASASPAPKRVPVAVAGPSAAPATKQVVRRTPRTKHVMKLRPRIVDGVRYNPTAKKVLKKAVLRKPVAAATAAPIRKNRETGAFPLDILDWSPWQPAMSLQKMRGGDWIPRLGDYGWRNTEALYNDPQEAVLYEFAVETPAGKKYPVLYRTSEGFSGCHWDTKLLNTPALMEQIDRILNKGCKLYLRSAQLDDSFTVNGQVIECMNELRSYIHKNYDYAWQQHYDIPSRRYLHRNVLRDGVLISDNRR